MPSVALMFPISTRSAKIIFRTPDPRPKSWMSTACCQVTLPPRAVPGCPVWLAGLPWCPLAQLPHLRLITEPPPSFPAGISLAIVCYWGMAWFASHTLAFLSGSSCCWWSPISKEMDLPCLLLPPPPPAPVSHPTSLQCSALVSFPYVYFFKLVLLLALEHEYIYIERETNPKCGKKFLKEPGCLFVNIACSMGHLVCNTGKHLSFQVIFGCPAIWKVGRSNNAFAFRRFRNRDRRCFPSQFFPKWYLF